MIEVISIAFLGAFVTLILAFLFAGLMEDMSGAFVGLVIGFCGTLYFLG